MQRSIWLSAIATLAACITSVVVHAQAVDEVVITGIRASLEASLTAKRNEDVVADFINAEDIGKFPDKNLAEALQRVPGVVINREFGEGERVSLRGTAPNLTRTLLNGHALATADWFILEQLAATRSFNYLMLPSDVISRVGVYKSPQADFEEGGIGGTIDVSTRNPLDLRPFEAYGSLQGAYTELSEEFDPQFSGLVSWRNDASTLGILGAAVYQERNIRRDGVEVLGYFDNDPGAAELLVPQLIGSALFQQERVRKGGNFGVQWKPNEQVDLNLTGLFSRFEADNINANFMAWGSQALGGGGTLTNATVIDDTVVAGTISSATAAGGGFDPMGRGVVYDAIDRLAHAETRSIDLDAVMRPTEGWNLHFKVGYTDAEGDTEAQPFVEFAAPASFSFDLRGESPQVQFSGVNPNNPAGMEFDFASLHQITNDDEEVYGYADAERELDVGFLKSVKFGAKYTDHDRATVFNATTFGSFFLPLQGMGCGGGPCGSANFQGAPTPNDFLDDIASPGTLTSYWQVDRGLVESTLFGSLAGRIPNPPENFSINEKTMGGYLMGNLEGERWRGNIGVRFVETDQTSKGNEGNEGPNATPNAFGSFIPVTFERTYSDTLPSANLVFDVTDNVLLRFAAARTIARPDFTDIVPRVTLNEGALSGTGGNPNIDPYRANQGDLSLEWYSDTNAALAFALYFKDIKSFITDRPVQDVFTIETLTPNLSRCTPAGGTNPNLYNCLFDINQRSNGGGGEIKGFELAGNLPIAAGFGLQGNYTYSDAEADNGDPIPGNSEDTFNVTAYFENQRMSAKLAYSYRSDFFVTFDRTTRLNQDSLESLDAALNVSVTPAVTAILEAQNITDEEIVQFAGDAFRPRAIYDNGRVYFAGVRVKF